MATGKLDLTEYKKIADQLKKRRLNLGLSQFGLSKMFGYTNGNFVCTLENNQTSIPIGKIRKAAKSYNLDGGMLAISLLKARNPDIWDAIKMIIDSEPVREGMSIDQIEKEADAFVDKIGDLSTAASK